MDFARANRPAALGDLVRQGYDVSAHFGACGHHAIVSARALAESRGEAFPVPALAPLLRGTKCGARGRSTVQVQARHVRPDERR